MQNEAIGPSKVQRVFLTTGIAETSVTLDGVSFVVDSGLTKEMRYDPRTGMDVLRLVHVSKAQADQRKGRAASTRPGECYWLYTEEFGL